MKKIASLLIAMFIFASTTYPALGHPNDIAYYSKKINGKYMNVVVINANSKDLTYGIIKSNNTLSGWENFENMINRKKPIAAINGNFFNAYTRNSKEILPYGYIYHEGKMINNGATLNKGSFAVLKDGTKVINNADEIDKDKVYTMIEAGPLLLLKGKIVYSPTNNGFNEDKINKSPAQRSAIGIKADGKILMVTGNSLKMIELAKIMKTLGCTSATNLDGGASSALYAKGKYLTKAGRDLNTVLAVYDKGKKTTKK